MALSRRSALQAAEKLVSRGRLEAAVKQYRKALDESPDDTGTLNRLGDLYARLNRVDAAVEMFTAAADRFSKEGFFVKAIAIYKKIIRLDPTLIKVYETLADLYRRQGLVNEARAQYQVVADYYQQADDTQALVAVFEKMVELEPDNPSHRLKLAEFYCGSEQIPQAMDQYQRIAHFMLKHGKVEEAFQVYLGAFELKVDDLGFLTDIIVQLTDLGHDEVAQRLLSRAVERNPDAARVAELVNLPVPDVAERRGALLPGEPIAGIEEPIPAEQAAAGAEARPPTQDSTEAAGSEVSLVSSEPAVQEAEPVLEPEIGGASALEEVEIESVPTPDLETAADDDTGEFEITLEDLELDAPAEVEAGAEEESEGADLTEMTELETSAAASIEEIAAEEPLEVDAQDGGVPLGSLEEPVVEPVELEETQPADSRADELVTEANVLANYGLESKAIELLENALRLAPAHAEAVELLLHLHHQEGQQEAVVEVAQRFVDAEALPPRVQELLEDWDYSIQAGRVHSPAGIEEPVEQVVVEPEVSPDSEAKLSWLDEEPEAADSDTLFGEEDEFFDLAAELEEELMAEESDSEGQLMPQLEEQSIEEIVEGFKQGVAETLSTEDYDTHYNLGIAYREMGLVDEAIGEFQLAAKSDKFLVDCCSLLGVSFLEKGFPDLAIKWYERGLKAPRVTDVEKLGLLYELGNLYLSTGEHGTAKETFAEIYGVNSNYRDVVAKLEELRQT